MRCSSILPPALLTAFAAGAFFLKPAHASPSPTAPAGWALGATGALLDQLRPCLATTYLIDTIGTGGFWLELDDGSCWIIDAADAWRLAHYIEGQLVVLLHERTWSGPQFSLLFGEGEKIGISPHAGPDSQFSRYRSITRLAKQRQKLRVSDGTWWQRCDGKPFPSHGPWRKGESVLLACRPHLFGGSGVVLVETEHWSTLEVEQARSEPNHGSCAPPAQQSAAQP
jgi:hypothetical protein